ncbi:hypothetical protein [Microbacterium sp. EST19A]|uniref:hypothetical protein n=1 Tax=Microbacterium sp. EST19A TaxID=2862681 RepID=UPI001CC180EA|nr:hypothetical protein [Microbacterium sp. EST19A]
MIGSLEIAQARVLAARAAERSGQKARDADSPHDETAPASPGIHLDRPLPRDGAD